MAERQGDWALLRRTWPYVSSHRLWLAVIAVAIPIGALGAVVQPILLKEGIDGHIARGDVEGLLGVALRYLGAVVIGFGGRALGMYGLQLIGLRGLAALRRDVFVHVTGQGARFFDRRTTGSLLTRTTTDVEAVYESLAFGAVGLIADALQIAGTLVAMLWLDWRLTLVTLALAPVIVAVVELFRRRTRVLALEIRKVLSRLNGYFAEQVYGMTIVQLYGAEARSRRTFRTIAYRFLNAYRRSNWYESGLYAVMDGMSSLAIGLMLWYGAARFGAADAGLTLGLLVAFIDYLAKVFVPIRDFSGRIGSLQRAAAALERVFGLLDTDERVAGGDLRLEAPAGLVRFSGVGFAYGEGQPEVLRDVSFEVAPGEVVALVGATGSGKSTIGRLLTHTYDGYRGSLTVDGREVRDVRLDDLRAAVTVVQQDAHLFRGSVADNLRLWSPALDDAALREAARLARADGFISELPGGYGHPLTERGGNLSAGQRQLLAIARALARDAPIVLLDEATASVDALTERQIDEAIEALFARKTVLVIAHRLSTITKVDRILVLHRGQVVEQGTHEQLAIAGGRYQLLVESGFAL